MRDGFDAAHAAGVITIGALVVLALMRRNLGGIAVKIGS